MPDLQCIENLRSPGLFNVDMLVGFGICWGFRDILGIQEHAGGVWGSVAC